MNPDVAAYSERFLEFLASEAPEWRSAVKSSVDADGKATGFFVVEIESPNTNASAPLWISTEEEEVTIGFDAYHGHFETWRLEAEEAAFKEALALARDIIAEKVLVASWWIGEKWCGSRLIEIGEKVEPSEGTSSDAHLRIRSWSGKRDYEEKG